MRIPLTEYVRMYRTGKFPIMQKLDAVLMRDPASQRNHPHLPDFSIRHHVDKVCPECVEWLGLTSEEVDHIDHWPIDLKEVLRFAIVRAIRLGKPMTWVWRSTDDEEEQALMTENEEKTVVCVATPRRVMRLAEDDEFGAIVEIGEVSNAVELFGEEIFDDRMIGSLPLP